MNPFVRVEGVKKVFETSKGPYVAVQDINLNINQGEFVAFIGHSGCGKSTVLNMIAGLYAPTQGQVMVDARVVKGPGSDRAMVFQNYSLLPWMSVRENVYQAVDSVYEFNMTAKEKAAVTDQFVEMVGLAPHRDKLPAMLSGGMKQRAAIARAFAIKPDVLLLDEPFGALDALTKGGLHDELLQIWNQSAGANRKQTILMVTHDIDEAIYLCDKVVVFTDGPGATIGEVLEVPIPRPRDKRTMVHLSAYADIKEHLIELLTVGHLKKQAERKGREVEKKPSVATLPRPIKIGFIPLTDCAPIVMAQELGLFQKHGVEVEVSREASWPSVRDKLITGELQAAHCLFGLPFSVYQGIAEPKGQEIPIAMNLSANGQGITLSRADFEGVGYSHLGHLRDRVESLAQKRGKAPIFASTFPGGTHDIWLRYTLMAAGVPVEDVKIITIPPSQMVLNMGLGNMDGFSAGEPYPALAVQKDAGFTFLATQDLWEDHPEKVLGVNPEFADERRDDLKRVMKAILEACQWLDADAANRVKAAQVLSASHYLATPTHLIEARLAGDYDLGSGLGHRRYETGNVRFCGAGAINFPRIGHAIWFQAQQERCGYTLKSRDYENVARKLVLQDLYREVAGEMKLSVPDDDMKPFSLKLDGIEFDPQNPLESLARYPVLAPTLTSVPLSPKKEAVVA